MKTKMMMTDEALVRAYEAGNNEAFELLFNRYKGRVYSYIYLIIRNRDICEDIFQDTFIKVITTIKQGRYSDSGKFLPWVNRIAHNLAIDYFRREQNENTSNCEEFGYDILNSKDLSDYSAEDTIVQEQILTDVARLVDFLPKNQREVLKMRYYEDLSFKEIADKTGVSINTALGRMRYALLNMRKIAQDNNVALC